MTPQRLSGFRSLHSGLSVSCVRCGMVSVVYPLRLCVIMLGLGLMDRSGDFLAFPMLTVCQRTVPCTCVQRRRLYLRSLISASSLFKVFSSGWFVSVYSGVANCNWYAVHTVIVATVPFLHKVCGTCVWQRMCLMGCAWSSGVAGKQAGGNKKSTHPVYSLSQEK